ncbi:MAG: hypothetical protein QHH13_05135 [Melioribacter sp.]|uniref:hypothetical protein n=1 Tax=Rosettibacter primus TaxID=3111523 RepID=UPI00247D1E7E|nr:hypothetical protein [Melioribacter sp.]
MSNEQTNILELILDELMQIRSDIHKLILVLMQTTDNKNGPIKKNINENTENSSSSKKVNDDNIAENEIEDKNLSSIYYWLMSRGITIINYKSLNNNDHVHDKLSLFLGNRFENLVLFHDGIRRCLSNGNVLRLNLYDYPQSVISDTTQFCTWLYEYAYLSSYRYIRQTRTILAQPQRIPKVINFLNGEWFERFIFLKLNSFFSQNKIKFSHLQNIQVTLPNGNQFEFDHIFLINGNPLWVECKTGDYQAYIERYSSTRRLLKIPKERSILIILGLDDNLCQTLTDLYDITVKNEKNIFNWISNIFAIQDDNVSISKSDNVDAASSAIDIYQTKNINEHDFEIHNLNIPNIICGGNSYNSSLSTLLKKSKLRPFPQFRNVIIKSLINAVENLVKPTTMVEVKNELAKKIVISKNQLQDILNAIVSSGCLLDENDQTVYSFTIPFIKLISYDPEVIEKKCIESYISAVLKVNQTFFDNSYNIVEFENVVGYRIYDKQFIEDIKRKQFNVY